jgi:hypothetical protein
MRILPSLRLAVVLVLGLLASACTHVAPYERGALAHTTMTSAALPGPAAGHLRAVQEGAVGGGSVAESGCGCN